MTTLLKVYIKGGLFERSRELLAELESAGYAENEVVRQYYFSAKLAVYILEKSNINLAANLCLCKMLNGVNSNNIYHVVTINGQILVT